MISNLQIEIGNRIKGRKIYETHNVVTNSGRDLIRMNLFHGGTARQLAWVHVGNMIMSVPNPLTERLDTDIVQRQWDGYTLVDGGIDCVYIMPEASYVGQTFNAAGIYTGQSANETMYAVATFPQITKTNLDYIAMTWQLRWSNYNPEV